MQRLPINGIEVFVAVAERGSLRKAAADLGVHPPAISYQINALEERIGSQLFERTTRSVKLTEAGHRLYTRARPALSDLGEAIEETRRTGRAKKGHLKLSLPYTAYRLVIAEKLSVFQSQYPDIEIELSFSEAFIDIVENRLHAGVRLGEHVHRDMIAKRLTPPFRDAFFAAPSYLSANLRPREPRDLLRHNCIRYRNISSQRIAQWRFKGRDGSFQIDVKGNLIVDNATAAIDAAQRGLGIASLFDICVDRQLREGSLETILGEYALEQSGYFIYYPKANSKMEILRLFIDFIRRRSGV